MMKQCPKCEGTQIIRIAGSKDRGGNNIPAGWTIFSSVPVTRFICRACGFSEEWVESAADREKLEDIGERSWFSNPPPEDGIV